MIKRFLNEVRNFLLFSVRYPWIKHGNNVHCQWSVVVGPRRRLKVALGDYVGIGEHALFACDITIGNHVLIASNVSFVGRDDHVINVVGKTIWNSGRGPGAAVVIEDDVWIGCGTIVMSGVRICRGAVVASGSIVTKDVAPYAVVGGNPSRLIRMRFTPEQIEEHERILYNFGATPRS